MFGLGPATKVYLAVGPTDLRKGFDGLHSLARNAPAKALPDPALDLRRCKGTLRYRPKCS